MLVCEHDDIGAAQTVAHASRTMSTCILSSIAGEARPVRTVAKLCFVLSMLFSILVICTSYTAVSMQASSILFTWGHRNKVQG